MAFLETLLTSEVCDIRFAAQRNETIKVRTRGNIFNARSSFLTVYSNQISSPRKRVSPTTMENKFINNQNTNSCAVQKFEDKKYICNPDRCSLKLTCSNSYTNTRLRPTRKGHGQARPTYGLSRGSSVVSPLAYHAASPGSIPGPGGEHY